MPLAARSLGSLVLQLENRADSQGKLVDRLLDMHSALTQWTVNTEHSEAAEEVIVILERAIQESRRDTVNVKQSVSTR